MPLEDTGAENSYPECGTHDSECHPYQRTRIYGSRRSAAQGDDVVLPGRAEMVSEPDTDVSTYSFS